jgi:hypothetical protein
MQNYQPIYRAAARAGCRIILADPAAVLGFALCAEM